MMSDRNLILTLAKVIIAAAWADGQVTLEEINSLKDLLFRLPYAGYKQYSRVTAREWATLELYMQSPVGAEERADLVKQLQTALRTSRDRTLALSVLEDLAQADGAITDDELAVVEEIKSAIDAVGLGIFAQLGRLIQGPLQRRSDAVANAPSRELHLEDFVKNRIFYSVRQRLDLGERALDIPETDLRKLSLAGGLMARVAHVDQAVTEDESDAMVNALQTGWDITPEAAAVVAEVAVSEVSADLDYFRLTREFFTGTTESERARFLEVLFALAKTDGQISYKESEEIRRIASSLNLTRRQFVDAKMRFREEKRCLDVPPG